MKGLWFFRHSSEVISRCACSKMASAAHVSVSQRGYTGEDGAAEGRC
jgi:hypothetical protein